MLDELKERVWKMNQNLFRHELVVLTSGNVSGRHLKENLVVIKPSGVPYEEIEITDMVVVDLKGNIIEGDKKPSSDTASHLYIYRNRRDIYGVAHTHSNYATSYAALGESIPACLTSIAAEFGGDIPIGSLATIGGEEIGQAILRDIGDSPGVLLKNHGVFTIGGSPEEAFEVARKIEDVAKTVHLAQTKGTPKRLSNYNIERLRRYYKTEYGQI